MRRAIFFGTLLLAAVAGGCDQPWFEEMKAKWPWAQRQPATTTTAPAPLEIVERASSAAGVVTRLANGLTLIVSENHNSPVVCVRAYVRAGGMLEGEYLGSGISHLCEHLVAKGAVHDDGPRAKAAKQTSSRVDQIGGQSNAYTSLDHTGYYIAAAAGKTDDCIDLIADWMSRAEITEADFRREHGVVQRELEMRRDDPARRMYYAHMRNVYGTHPAAVPVIGYQKPLSELSYQDVLDYHRRMYVPQNMVVVVVGDVSTEKVLDRARRAFAGFPPGRTPELSLPAVPAVAGRRRSVLTHSTVTEAVENISFQTIPLLHQDLYALDVLSYILTNGDSARLVEAVKRRRRLVTSISSYSWTPGWGKGQFTVSFRSRPESADEAEQAILAELRRVVSEGVTDAELARAKRQKVADFVYSQQTVQSQAGTLGSDYLTTGDVEFSRLYTDRIQQVTAEQVKAAAEKYFDFERTVITRMLPGGSPAARAAASQPVGKAGTSFFKLPNGLRVVLHSTPKVELVSMVLTTRGGVLVETPASNGMGALMTALSTKGAGDLSAEDIAAFFAGAGGSVSANCGNNTFYWQATVLSDSFAQALPIFADIVQNPTYPAKELEILRPILLARIRQRREQWFGLLYEQFRKDFFRDSPLALMTSGSAAVVSAATPKSIAEYHKRHLKAGASVLAIYGRFDPVWARVQVQKLFASLPAGDNKVPERPARSVPPAGERHVHPSKLKGAGVIVAAPGMKLSELSDRLAITVLDTIISGYRLPRGWLHSQLRGQRLVYVVHAYNFPALVPGAFVVYAHSKPGNAARVAEIIRSNLRRTLTHPFTPGEVDEAVNMILTAELLANQQMSALAMQAALDELYGFGYDFRRRYEKLLRAITPADVSRAARKYLSGGFVTVIVTPRPELLSKPGK